MTGQCKKSNCQRPVCRYTVESGMQCDECKGWYHEVCTNLTPAASKRFSKKGCVWLCQQCCSDANSLLTEAISLVDAAKCALASIVGTHQTALDLSTRKST
ncbi:unnamed protein product [Schistosoma bovis]|nr:unnamed protein product [Schistosoma bovis]